MRRRDILVEPRNSGLACDVTTERRLCWGTACKVTRALSGVEELKGGWHHFIFSFSRQQSKHKYDIICFLAWNNNTPRHLYLLKLLPNFILLCFTNDVAHKSLTQKKKIKLVWCIQFVVKDASIGKTIIIVCAETAKIIPAMFGTFRSAKKYDPYTDPLRANLYQQYHKQANDAASYRPT